MGRLLTLGIATLGLLAPGLAGAEDEAAAPAASTSPAPAAAPAQPAGSGSPPPMPAVFDRPLEGEIPLTLNDALALAIENNLRVAIDRYDPYIAEEAATSAWGAYDPELSADWNYERAEVPTANPLNTGSGVDILDNDQIGGTGGLSGLVPKVGAAYQIAYVGQSVETSSGFPNLSPQYNTDLSARMSFPLLQGFLWGEPWVTVKTTRLGQSTSEERFRQSLMDTVRDVEFAYWDLTARRDELGVAEKSLETARALLEQTRAQYDVGVVSRVEVVEAEAGVADREFNRIVQANVERRAQDVLVDLILGERLRPETDFDVVLRDSPEPVAYEVDPEEAAAKAFSNRPEIEQARQEIERRDLLLRFAENQRLPQLDVVGGYGYTGIAGKANPEPFNTGSGPITRGEFARRRYGSADDDFFSSDAARTWSGGAIFSIPLGNTRGRADARAAAFELRKAHTALLRAEQDVVLDVRNAIRNLLSAQEGIVAAQEARRSAEEQLRAERIRLEHGESTPFNVLQKEEDYRTAEFKYIAALQSYRNSITALDRAQGTILGDRGIEVEAARELR